ADSYVVVWDGDGDPVRWEHLEAGHVPTTVALGASGLWWDEQDLASPDLGGAGWQARLDGAETRWAALPVARGASVEPESGRVPWGGWAGPGPGVVAGPAGDPRGARVWGWAPADRLYEAPLDGTGSPREVVNLYDDLFMGRYLPLCSHANRAWVYDGRFPVF